MSQIKNYRSYNSKYQPKPTVAMQNGRLFLQLAQVSSVSGSSESQKGHGVLGSSISDFSGFLNLNKIKQTSNIS